MDISTDGEHVFYFLMFISLSVWSLSVFSVTLFCEVSEGILNKNMFFYLWISLMQRVSSQLLISWKEATFHTAHSGWFLVKQKTVGEDVLKCK